LLCFYKKAQQVDKKRAQTRFCVLCFVYLLWPLVRLCAHREDAYRMVVPAPVPPHTGLQALWVDVGGRVGGWVGERKRERERERENERERKREKERERERDECVRLCVSARALELMQNEAK